MGITQPCWSKLCTVDVSAIVAWLTSAPPAWPELANPAKPARIFEPPAELLASVLPRVLAQFTDARAHQTMLSRMRPGQQHPLHVDIQRSDWITRIHVPLLTNPRAWLLFEEEGTKLHFDVGYAYTFDTLRRHAFGNDGDTDRVHLIFDVIRKDG